MRELDAAEVAAEVAEAEQVLAEVDPRGLHLWERVRIEPARWGQCQYGSSERFWVVAILGTRCF